MLHCWDISNSLGLFALHYRRYTGHVHRIGKRAARFFSLTLRFSQSVLSVAFGRSTCSVRPAFWWFSSTRIHFTLHRQGIFVHMAWQDCYSGDRGPGRLAFYPTTTRMYVLSGNWLHTCKCRQDPLLSLVPVCSALHQKRCTIDLGVTKRSGRPESVSITVPHGINHLSWCGSLSSNVRSSG